MAKGFHPKTQFKKGHKTWNKGKKHLQITGEKNGNWKGGKHKTDCLECGKSIFRHPSTIRNKVFCSKKCFWENAKKDPLYGSWNIGIKRTTKQKERMSEIKKGQLPWNTGKKRPEMTGENNPRWIKDRTKLAKRQERNDSAYQEWRKQVWERDNWKCRINNHDCNGKIIAHHILGWSLYSELRYEINNGITLCQAHHPRKRAEEKRLIPFFSGLASVSKV